MYDIILKQLAARKKPLEVIVVGLGFMGFGFISYIRKIAGITVPLLITRRPTEANNWLTKAGFKVKIVRGVKQIKSLAKRGYLCIGNSLDLISAYPAEIVLEVTGDVAYGTEVALRTLESGKNLVTMNVEMQATVGSQLAAIAKRKKLVITDVVGDQPGSIARMINQARLMGFRVLMAGNMKRYLDIHATGEKMQSWAKQYGLSVRQTTSFTDGTKQALEMNLVANYFGMTILKPGMIGPAVETVQEALSIFNWHKIPKVGVVDYVIGMKLLPGVFLVVEHGDKNQAQYLRYLKMGDGPRYVLFEPYHLCHLEALVTIAETALFGQKTINNGLVPVTRTIAVAKFDFKRGQVLDGIGGDTVYGKIEVASKVGSYLPVGLSFGAILRRDLEQDEPVKISDVILPSNAATRLLKLA